MSATHRDHDVCSVHVDAASVASIAWITTGTCGLVSLNRVVDKIDRSSQIAERSAIARLISLKGTSHDSRCADTHRVNGSACRILPGCRTYVVNELTMDDVERSSIAIDRSASGRRACACTIGPMTVGQRNILQRQSWSRGIKVVVVHQQLPDLAAAVQCYQIASVDDCVLGDGLGGTENELVGRRAAIESDDSAGSNGRFECALRTTGRSSIAHDIGVTC